MTLFEGCAKGCGAHCKEVSQKSTASKFLLEAMARPVHGKRSEMNHKERGVVGLLPR